MHRVLATPECSAVPRSRALTCSVLSCSVPACLPRCATRRGYREDLSRIWVATMQSMHYMVHPIQDEFGLLSLEAVVRVYVEPDIKHITDLNGPAHLDLNPAMSHPIPSPLCQIGCTWSASCPDTRPLRQRARKVTTAACRYARWLHATHDRANSGTRAA